MKFDLHIHSSKSYDSFMSVEDIIQAAVRKNISGIAITDHGEFNRDAMQIKSDSNNIIIINGSEIYTEIGDIIGLFLVKPLKSSDAESLIDEIHDQGGIAVLAHPFKRIVNYPNKIIKKLDAVEVINSRWKNLDNYRSDPRVDELLSNVKGRTAGSDAHYLFEIGRAYLSTPKIDSIDDLKKVICNGDGVVHSLHYSAWPDIASQVNKFIKKPSMKQFIRIFYYTLQKVFSVGKKGTF
ncbi:PHP domain-containing protein [Thermodesulfobacteriota bacterium]